MHVLWRLQMTSQNMLSLSLRLPSHETAFDSKCYHPEAVSNVACQSDKISRTLIPTSQVSSGYSATASLPVQIQRNKLWMIKVILITISSQNYKCIQIILIAISLEISRVFWFSYTVARLLFFFWEQLWISHLVFRLQKKEPTEGIVSGGCIAQTTNWW